MVTHFTRIETPADNTEVHLMLLRLCTAGVTLKTKFRTDAEHHTTGFLEESWMSPADLSAIIMRVNKEDVTKLKSKSPNGVTTN